MARILKPGGVAVVTVPVERRLCKRHRDVWGHLRLYTREILVHQARKADLQPEHAIFISGLAHYLWNYPKYGIYLLWLALTGNLFRRLKGEPVPSYYASLFHRKIVMPFYDRLLALDFVLSTKKIFQSGPNVLLLARKPETSQAPRGQFTEAVRGSSMMSEGQRNRRERVSTREANLSF